MFVSLVLQTAAAHVFGMCRCACRVSVLSFERLQARLEWRLHFVYVGVAISFPALGFRSLATAPDKLDFPEGGRFWCSCVLQVTP